VLRKDQRSSQQLGLANGTCLVRLNGRGYKKVNWEHFDSSDIAALKTNEMTVRNKLYIALMAEWIMHEVDVKGEFLITWPL